jgi:adenosine deaminase
MIDLHRHCGGSISASTLQNIIKHHGGDISIQEIEKQLLFKKNEKKTFHGFLNKFNILDKIKWDPWSIDYTIRQIVWNLSKEGIKYCELKLSIGRYIKDTGWTPEDVIKHIDYILQEEGQRWDIQVGISLCLKYESKPKLQKRIAKIILDNKARDAVTAIDLVGDEAYFSPKLYKPIFKLWKEAGKGLQAHVGESCSAENVQLAIEYLGVQRIAHGIQIINNINIMKMVKERGIPLDIALTSNLYTGVVKKIKQHPIKKFFDFGIPITIGTDDPIILNTNLVKEYELAKKNFGFSDEELNKIMSNSFKFAFHPKIKAQSTSC